MCIGVPMVIESIHGFSATCEARGSRRSVSLMLLEPGSAVAGDYVLVHQGIWASPRRTRPLRHGPTERARGLCRLASPLPCRRVPDA